ncbi:MAG: hypothetical protein GY822_18060 [Deltaproteobacteria bacterium]|nr:hypothetical protein [Deltaproteobacteria bacterium]
MTSTEPWLAALCGGFEILFQLCEVEGTLTLKVDAPPSSDELGALHLLFALQ